MFMQALRANELGISGNATVQGTIDFHMMQDCDANVDDSADISNVLHWEDDAGERSRRIYEWWRSIVVESEGVWLPCFEKMFVLMCLARQPSSAVVERVFSQVNHVRSLCGNALNEDNI